MYIGLLNTNESGLDITYRYFRSDSQTVYNPDYTPDTPDKICYDMSDRLFTDYVAYNGNNLYMSSVDIRLDIGMTCFIDNIALSQTAESEMAEIRVFIKDNKVLKPVGILRPQSRKNLTDTDMEIPIGVYTDNLVIRIKCVCKHMSFGKLKIYGAADIENALYPNPKEINGGKGCLSRVDEIIADGDDAIFAANNYADKLAETVIFPVGYISVCTKEQENNTISFSLSDLPADAYTISVTEHRAAVHGGSRRALLYASEKLLQLTSEEGIRCCEIKDSPFMGIRGVHFALPSRCELDFMHRMIKYVCMPMGYNTIFLQLSGAMEYKRHPKINSAWKDACNSFEAGDAPMPSHYDFVGHDILTHEEIRNICDYIRSYGFEIVPEVQCFSHAQYITMAYPGLGEREIKPHGDIDMTAEDVRPDDMYAHSMCPNHPDYYKVVFDIIDEVAEVIKPEKYLHIGHDEIYTIAGDCDRCRGIPEEEIYAKEVNTLNAYIKSKGLTTMMWSDMIQEPNYASHKAIGMIDKDIVCLSFTWYFRPNEDVEDVLYDNGFDVVIGNMYSSHYPRFNRRKYGRNLLGAEVSTWVPCTEFDYAYIGKTYDIIYTANMLWNEVYMENMRLTYTELANKHLNYARSRIGDKVMNPDAVSINCGMTASAVPYDITADFDGALQLGRGNDISIPINTKSAKISFLHATDTNAERKSWYQLEHIASYYMEYADGSVYEDKIYYAANIYEYKKRFAQPVQSMLYRHEGYFATALSEPVMGKTAEGEDYTLYNYTMVNPFPDKVINNIKLRITSDTDVKILLFDIKI